MADDAGAPVAGLSNVKIDYPGRASLGPLDLTVGPREIVAVVGASGAGKSTALRLLAGLDPADREPPAAGPGLKSLRSLARG